jgi:XTP/dITP diphosphohydrolase
LFELIEYHRTFGQLGPTVKSFLSHRARAARRLVPELIRLVDSGRWA